MNTTVPGSFPSADINPKQKGKEWHLQFAKAAWAESGNQPAGSVFYRNAEKYKEIRKYVAGNQDIDIYKKMLIGDEQADSTWMNIDWTPRKVVNKNRDIAISKLLQRPCNIVATPVDGLAKDQMDEYYNGVRVKILMRDAMKKINSELVDNPELQPEPGDPRDLEELEMEMEFGGKHNMAKEAEMGIRLINFQNDFDEHRKTTIEHLFDFGVGGYKEWVNEQGKVKLRAVKPECVIVAPCRNADFTDAPYIGELIYEEIGNLGNHFTDQELKELAERHLGRHGNPTYIPNNNVYGRGFEKFKVEVLDLEFFSWDETVYKQRLDRRGNLVYRKTKYEDRNKVRNISVGDNQEDKYSVRKAKMVYKCKWIIGTNLIYDFGKANYQKRGKSNMCETSLSFHLYAIDFNEMQSHGFMERLMPVIDEYQMTIYKIQNFKIRWIPYIIDIDLDSLEGVALGKGGENMKPMDLIDMMFQTHVLVGRRRDQAGNPNYKSIEVRSTNMAEEFSVLVNDLSRLLLEMQQLCGLNDITDGSTPSDRMLNGVAGLANVSTNNALYPLMKADKKTTEKTAEGTIQRLQIVIKDGNVEGALPALGTNTVTFFRLSPNITLHEFGIMLEDKPTEEQKALLFEKMNLKDAQGLIEPEDWALALTIDNMKQLAQLLSHRVKKRKAEQQQKAIELQQQNGQIQQQSAIVAEEEKRKTLELEHIFKMKEIEAKGAIDMRIMEMKLQQSAGTSQQAAEAKVISALVQGETQENLQKREMGQPVV
jgi:hypothetical protein